MPAMPGYANLKEHGALLIKTACPHATIGA